MTTSATPPVTLDFSTAQPIQQQVPESTSNAPVTLDFSTAQPISNTDTQTTAAQPDPNNPLAITADTNHSLMGSVQQLNSVGAGIGEGLLHTLNGGAELLHLPHATLQAREDELKRNNSVNPVERDAGLTSEAIAEFAMGDEALKGLTASEKFAKAAGLAKTIEQSPLLTRVVAAAIRNGTVGTAQGLLHDGRWGNVGNAAEQGAVAGVTGGAMEGAGGVILPKIADLAEGKANDLYSRALGPSGKIDNARAAQVAPDLVKRVGFAGSMDSLKAKAAEYLAEAGDKLGEVEDSLSPDLKVDTSAASQSLRNLASSNTLTAKGDLPVLKTIPHTSSILDEFGKPIITSTDIPDIQPSTVEDQTGHSNAIRNTANQLAGQIDKIDPSIQNVIKQRRILDDGLSGVYKGSDPAANGSVLAQKHAADVLRAQIAASSPEMDAANKEYSFWRKTNEVLDNTIRRRTGKTGGLLNMAAAGEAGLHLAAGDVPGAVATFGGLKAMRGLLYSVPGLTGRAALLNKLATTVGTGDVSGTLGLLKKEAGPAVAALFSNLYAQHSGEKSPSK